MNVDVSFFNAVNFIMVKLYLALLEIFDYDCKDYCSVGDSSRVGGSINTSRCGNECEGPTR